MRKVHVCDLSPLVYGVVFAYGQYIYIYIIITNNADNHSDNESDNDDDE